ncbi:MAG TPA: hypothetical protein VIK91_00815 [Nannocystis sp.]
MALLLAPFFIGGRADAADDSARAPAEPQQPMQQHETRFSDADGGLARAAWCMGKCYDRRAGQPCLQRCVRRIEHNINAPAPATLEQLSACIDDCYADRSLRRTDRETCKLTCELVASLAGPGVR